MCCTCGSATPVNSAETPTYMVNQPSQSHSSKQIPMDSNPNTSIVQQNHTPYPMNQTHPHPSVGNFMSPVPYLPPEMGMVPLPYPMPPPPDVPPPYEQCVDQAVPVTTEDQ
ncbi:hypothetical protein ACTXT7_012049 [Hymenolepis weldensis]